MVKALVGPVFALVYTKAGPIEQIADLAMVQTLSTCFRLLHRSADFAVFRAPKTFVAER